MARVRVTNFKGQSEFTGTVRRNTLPAKDRGAPLDAQERWRLIRLTGTEDITAEPDGRRSWNGLARSPHSVVDEFL